MEENVSDMFYLTEEPSEVKTKKVSLCRVSSSLEKEVASYREA